jgi:hypothetical protein
MDWWSQRIAYDPFLKRPASPEVQRRLGCAQTVSFLFPKESWLPMVTTNMKVLTVSEEQMRTLMESVKRENTLCV